VILELLEATGRLQELGALVYIVYSVIQQLRWEPVETVGMWRAPGIIGAIGLVSLFGTGLTSASGLEVLLLVGSALVALACGLLSGVAARFRPLSAGSRARIEQRRSRRGGRGRRPRGSASVGGAAEDEPFPADEMRTGWVGAVLWAVTIASRYGFEFLGEELHAPLVTTTGLALVLVALNEGGRVGVLAWRRRRISASA
jgi:hypothetical protein